MRVTALPNDYKSPKRFVKISKNDTLYLFATAKYDVMVEYASSNFYAPDFYYVSVKDKDGTQIWSGGKSVFLDSLFRAHFISDRFDKMILNRVNDTANSHSQQMILVDLKTSLETVLSEEGFYGSFGNFGSLDAVFFHADGTAVKCVDFENKIDFRLDLLLAKHIPGKKTWGLSPISNCILVCTEADENNLLLFDIRQEVIVGQCTFNHAKADSMGTYFHLISEHDKSAEITVMYSNRNAIGNLVHAGNDYFRIDF
ncbi:MAG: hypothetical protein IPH78_13220 [Bacteroidetes bacterium]|nr:hypothetical protein [Bacteroidota bacterium]MBK8658322.1 hypothetical protein [Bacteroidota bacterium]